MAWRSRLGWQIPVGLVAGWLLACRPESASEPPSVSAPVPHQPARSASEPELRERPAAEPVHDRDAALVAATHGNPEGAAEFLTEHLDAEPGDLEARLTLARTLWALGHYERADAVLEDPAGTPTAPRTMLARARLAWFLGAATQAEQLIRDLLEREPDRLDARGELLWLLVRTGRGDTAEAATLRDGLYDAYDAGNADTAPKLLAVAKAALSRGSSGAFHDANMVLGEAEQLAPAEQGRWISDRVLLQRGAMFLEKYAGSEAAATYELMLQRDAWHPEALVGMARVHVDSMQFTQALQRAREALEVNPNHPDAHALLARLALSEGRREQARRRIEQHVLAVNPNHVEGLAVLSALAILENEQEAHAEWQKRALAFNPRNGPYFRELADMLGFLHLYRQSDRVLQHAAELVPDDPYIQSALGINLLRLGQEDAGIAALERAWDGDPFNVRTHNVLDLYEQRIKDHYTDVERGELKLRLPSEDRELVQPQIFEAVQSARRALDARYGMDPGPLRLEFYAAPEEFSIRTVGVPSLGAVGVCFGDVITFVGPYRGRHNLHGVIWHELAHVYAIKKSQGRVPRWFTEGLSEWESELADPSWARESARLLLKTRRRGKLRPLSELEQAFIRAESPTMMEAAYATSAYAVRYLGETYGLPKLIAMLEGYGTGADTETLMKQHLGKDIATVEAEFEAWLDEQLAAKISGWQPRPKGMPEQDLDERDHLFRGALKQLEAEAPADAAETLQKLIHRDGDGYVSRMLLARVLIETGAKPKVIRKHLEKARTFDREAIEPLVLLAELARDEQDLDAEKHHLHQALAIDGDAIDPAARLLMLAEVTGDAEARAMALERSAAIAPLHPMVLAMRALDRARAGKPAAGMPLFRRAMQSLQDGQGPAETYVIAALAAEAVGEDALVTMLAERALQDESLPEPARELMQDRT